nr:xylulose kinase-1 [Tanacetum cinerariifolium]
MLGIAKWAMVGRGARLVPGLDKDVFCSSKVLFKFQGWAGITLKGYKDEYETWAMKMEYWIMNTDHNIWKVIQNENIKKSLGRDSKGGIIILPPVSFEEHVAVQRETKARTLLLQSLPEDHMADFHYMDDAREICIMENVLHSFVAENEPTQQLAYEDFEQVDQLEMEELDIKWQMAMLSLRINKFQKKADPAINAAGSLYDAAAEFAMMGISPKLDLEPVTREVKSLYERFVKASNMHEVPSSITGTFMPTSSNSVLEETQVTFGSKSPTSINTSDSNDSVSCDNNDKSSESDTHDFASCVLSHTPADSFSTVNVKILPKSDVKDPSPTNGVSSCSITENVKPPSDLCNKRRIAGWNNCNNNFVRTKTCFVCGSKSHLIKDCYEYDTVDNFPLVVLKAASVPAGSRNSSASTSAGRSIPTASRNRSASIPTRRSLPAASRNRSASIHAGRSIPATSRNSSASIHAGRSIPAASSNRPASIHAGRHIPAGRSNKLTPFPASRIVPTDIGIVDSGCSRSMTGNKDKLDDFVHVKGGTVTFGGGDAKATYQLSVGKSILRRVYQMAHVNFKTINKLAKLGLVEGLPLKLFTNNHKCVAYNKGKQHKATYKAVSAMRTIFEPL